MTRSANLGFAWGPDCKAGQLEREMAARADILAVQELGPIGAMRNASDESHVLRLGLEALRQAFRTGVVLEGLNAYLTKKLEA